MHLPFSFPAGRKPVQIRGEREAVPSVARNGGILRASSHRGIGAERFSPPCGHPWRIRALARDRAIGGEIRTPLPLQPASCDCAMTALRCPTGRRMGVCRSVRRRSGWSGRSWTPGRCFTPACPGRCGATHGGTFSPDGWEVQNRRAAVLHPEHRDQADAGDPKGVQDVRSPFSDAAGPVPAPPPWPLRR
ncbi:hypothetical protein SAMN04488239_10555 [Ruegeria marina]|uniref:Uncharacterized protein n=1 Tax=Ruegeria marina TaxID=639004 RepID=A0A1G6RSQ6_9RHOB|nr:hypothetical protein SAMN04488239_10555 [Ruegeria marina]